ncbi:MAG: tetraacyldisaccharide 4'-kinase, partial [Acidaminococcaceae bacterium]|nr:tetraacyldisaccharide 4'-kinase [Acidaminococcaceae bacterium]
HLGAEVIIMDDGYQHWQLYRDLDVVLVDTLNMFGNGSLLPRGTLREPLQNLSRAGLFLLTKCDQSSPISQDTLCDTLHKYNPKAPIIKSVHRPCNYVEIADWYKGIQAQSIALADLQGQSVMVFSAIGNPSSFEQTLTDVGLNIEEAIRYPDHHDYGMVEMQYIMELAANKKVKALITTTKDAVKIPTEFIYSVRAVPLYILNMEIQIQSSPQEVESILKTVIKKEIKK